MCEKCEIDKEYRKEGFDPCYWCTGDEKETIKILKEKQNER